MLRFRLRAGCAKVFARSHYSETMEELRNIKKSTCHSIFDKCIHSFVREIFNESVNIPSNDDLKRTLHVLIIWGFNGCFGSIDCTHIYWKRCPKE